MDRRQIVSFELDFGGSFFYASISLGNGDTVQPDRLSGERLRLTLEAACTVAWEVRIADGSLQETGPLDRLFGRSPGAVHPKVENFLADVHPDDRDRVRDALTAALRGEGEYRVEFRVPQPDGTEKWIAANGTLIRNEKGEPEYLTGVAVNVSERKQIEMSLREREQELEAAQRIAKIGSWQWEIVTDNASWSDETFRIFGLQPGSLQPHRSRFVSTIHPEDRARVDQALTDALEGRADYDLVYRIVTPQAGEKIIHARGEVIRDERGKPTLMRGTVHDITERRQAELEREHLEDQLRQAQKLESIGRLAGGVAHDFNNLLTVINGYTDFVLDQLEAQDTVRDSLLEIRKAGERAADLTRQLLAFSRKQIIQPQPVDLNELIRNSLDMLARVLGEDVEIVTSLDAVPSPVMADPGQLHQVLLNLVVNARDAMPSGGRVTIGSSTLRLDQAAATSIPGARPGPYAVLEVTDTGVGMSEETQKRIFEPFFTTKRTGQGTGLGLSTVYGIVRQGTGWIDVKSKLGAGSAFRIGFPLLAASAAEEQRVEPGRRQLTGGETVLVVEDEREVRKLAVSVLKRLGYRTLAADSGDDALSVAENHPGPIHLLLTDIVMPGMTGKHLAERLRKARPEMRVIYMSGYTDEIISRHGVLESGVEFLQKPFSQTALAQKVRTVLDAGRQGTSGPDQA